MRRLADSDRGVAAVVAVAAGARARHGRPTENNSYSRIRSRMESNCGCAMRASGKTRKLEGIKVNAVLGDPVDWMTDGKTLLVKSIPAGRTAAPAEPTVPRGPAVQESAGKAGPVPTYEDMLQNPHDEDLFEYYATSQLLRVDVATGKSTALGKPGILEGVTPSPDGKDILVTRIHRHFPYLHPAREFPTEVEVWDQTGAVAYQSREPAASERVPLGGVRTGPRQYRWMPTEGATLMWIEAMDGGNPKEKVPNRDRILTMAAPFKGEPVELFKTEQRFAGIQFAKNWALVEGHQSRHACGAHVPIGSDETGRASQNDLEPQPAGSLQRSGAARGASDRYRTAADRAERRLDSSDGTGCVAQGRSSIPAALQPRDQADG
jgi:hypothetical protein